MLQKYIWVLIYITKFLYYKVLKINVFKFFWKCHIKMLPGFAIAIIISLIANRFISLASPMLTLLVKGTIFVLAYVCSMWLMGWNSEEKNLIKSVIKR